MPVPPFLVLVQDSNPARYFHVPVMDRTNEILKLEPPVGKVWEIIAGQFIYAADANVADRTVALTLRTPQAYSAAHYGSKVVAALAALYLHVGSRPDANMEGASAEYLETRPIIAAGCYLEFKASANGQVGDTLSFKGLIKETNNYMHGGDQ